ncbi:STAS domain-containing protein [Actinoplanes sp. KI2]|uniref:STAS domain-containing protein n=1 Tax=Actinoplanes sp. KI2 TaxID=2983315 RepID=UPI0021D5BFF2|nr:STAS domain-containing protein [Actinoplanes sp. KI2]MCU7727962.1 STAS domain-containing protein [Actinoplanes sp. KI2]
MSTALTLTTGTRPDGTVVLAAVGEIDMSNAENFSAALAGTGDGALVVDLTGVEYIDSAGLAAIFPYLERVHLVATPLLAPVLTIAGLDDLTTVEER